jgi:hypothetical protein
VFDSLVAQYCTPAATAAATAAASKAVSTTDAAGLVEGNVTGQAPDSGPGAAPAKSRKGKAGSGAKAQQQHQFSSEEALLLALKGVQPLASGASVEGGATTQQRSASDLSQVTAPPESSQVQAQVASKPEDTGSTDAAVDGSGAATSTDTQQAKQDAELQAQEGSGEPQHGALDLSQLLDAYSSFADQGREQELVAAMVQVRKLFATVLLLDTWLPASILVGANQHPCLDSETCTQWIVLQCPVLLLCWQQHFAMSGGIGFMQFMLCSLCSTCLRIQVMCCVAQALHLSNSVCRASLLR